jgi:predicted Zn-dependent protease with MMP-like domain
MLWIVRRRGRRAAGEKRKREERRAAEEKPDRCYGLPPVIDPNQTGFATGDPFDDYLEQAIDAIPEPFASQLGSVAIVVEDWPTADQLASVHAHGLYGLYQGVPRTVFGVDNVGMPSKITIFRGPLVLHHRDPASLREAVFDVVLHEIAHHFGISDNRLGELQGGR